MRSNKKNTDSPTELKDLNTPSPLKIGNNSGRNTIPQKDDTPFIKETELEEFNLIGGSGLNSS